MKKIKSKVRTVVAYLLSVEGKPQKVALPYALGIFLATTPFIGFKVLIALLVTQLCKWKKGPAIVGVYHINSLTGPVFYAFSFLLGKAVTGYDCTFTFPDHLSFQAVLTSFAGSKEIFFSLLTGGLIIGLPSSFLAYKLIMGIIYKNKAVACLSQN